jgi:methylglutaconyl-CoA hydratase
LIAAEIARNIRLAYGAQPARRLWRCAKADEPMEFTSLEVTRSGNAATIWLNRPDKNNALNSRLIEELTDALHILERDPSVRVIVLAGRGKYFSVGADLKSLGDASENGLDEHFNDARRLAEMLHTLAGLRKPTIARVHGSALGAGMGLAAACDICVAARPAAFGAPDARLGLIPATISPYVLRAIGPRQALRYFLTAERIPAARAHELGLAHEVVKTGRLDATIEKLVEALLESGPRALTAAKALVRDVADAPIDETLLNETSWKIAHLRASPEAREGLAALVEKRKPVWGG